MRGWAHRQYLFRLVVESRRDLEQRRKHCDRRYRVRTIPTEGFGYVVSMVRGIAENIERLEEVPDPRLLVPGFMITAPLSRGLGGARNRVGWCRRRFRRLPTIQ